MLSLQNRIQPNFILYINIRLLVKTAHEVIGPALRLKDLEIT